MLLCKLCLRLGNSYMPVKLLYLPPVSEIYSFARFCSSGCPARTDCFGQTEVCDGTQPTFFNLKRFIHDQNNIEIVLIPTYNQSYQTATIHSCDFPDWTFVRSGGLSTSKTIGNIESLSCHWEGNITPKITLWSDWTLPLDLARGQH